MGYHKKTILLIVIATIIRCIIACCTGLGNDEVYYRLYAQHLQWNYFDHPPMVGWLIRFTTANLALDNELFIRLGAILSAAATTWLLYCCGKKISTPYTGFVAAALYTATVYGSIIAGTFILPDSPQMVCWAAGLYLLVGITGYTHINRTKKRKLLLFGLVAGVGMLCKIHTAFLWIGFLLYVLFHNRQWLKEPVLYIAGIITLILFFPVIQWNINHHFVTYLYHGSRVNIAHSGFDASTLGTFTVGQFFYTNPILFPYFAIATAAAFKNNLPIMASQKRLLLLCSLPLIGISLVIAAFKAVLPHWTGPAYLSLILLTACWFSKQPEGKRNAPINKRLPKAIGLAISLLLLIIAAGLPLIHYMPGTLGSKSPNKLGEGDFTLDMYGWGNLRQQFVTIAEQDVAKGIMQRNAPIITNKWFPAAHLDYYVALPLKRTVLAIGDTNDIHQYIWLNAERPALQQEDDAYCIVPSNYYLDAAAVYGPYFKEVLAPQVITQQRNGMACRYFYVWRLKQYKGKPS